jgi:hypothetical protein
MTSRTFYKTTFVVEILSEKPLPESMDLKDALEEAENGGYSGDVKSQVEVQVNGQDMAKLLIGQRSDPAFFQLTDDGEDDEEEQENLKYKYEEASGNTVDENDNIRDESGRLISRWDPNMAREYLSAAKESDE